MARTGAGVVDGGVLPVREVVFDALEGGDLSAAVCEHGVGAPDGFEVVGV